MLLLATGVNSSNEHVTGVNDTNIDDSIELVIPQSPALSPKQNKNHWVRNEAMLTCIIDNDHDTNNNSTATLPPIPGIHILAVNEVFMFLFRLIGCCLGDILLVVAFFLFFHSSFFCFFLFFRFVLLSFFFS